MYSLYIWHLFNMKTDDSVCMGVKNQADLPRQAIFIGGCVCVCDSHIHQQSQGCNSLRLVS